MDWDKWVGLPTSPLPGITPSLGNLLLGPVDLHKTMVTSSGTGGMLVNLLSVFFWTKIGQSHLSHTCRRPSPISSVRGRGFRMSSRPSFIPVTCQFQCGRNKSKTNWQGSDTVPANLVSLSTFPCKFLSLLSVNNSFLWTRSTYKGRDRQTERDRIDHFLSPVGHWF